MTNALFSCHPFFGRILKECMRKFTGIEHFYTQIGGGSFQFCLIINKSLHAPILYKNSLDAPEHSIRSSTYTEMYVRC